MIAYNRRKAVIKPISTEPRDRRNPKRSSRIMNSYMDIYLEQLRVRVEEDYEDMSVFAADTVERVLREKPDAVLGLPTGSTPMRMYEIIIERYKEGRFDFSQATIFNLDEYHPISPKNIQSYTYFMHDNLLKHINLPKDRFFIPNGEATDVEMECARFDRELKAAGGIDLQILGVGPNGHIAFNEPNDHFTKKTHYTKLTDSTIKANSRFFEDKSEMPEHALSMGIQSLFNAEEILMLANGDTKTEIAQKLLMGPVQPTVPASILQLHPNTTVALDKMAARDLVKGLVKSL